MYENKMNGYFSHCRTDLIDAIPRGRRNKILEIGAGSGETLLKAKELGVAEEIVGVELVPLENSNQSHPDMDRFIIGDIETADLALPREYFDVILSGDVLEHLVDPWKTVKRLSFYLKPKGYFITSIPNFREIKTLANVVLLGNFKYTNTGILDNTHLRFFCKKNMVDLFEQNGFTVIKILSNLDLLKKGRRAFLNKLTFRLFAEFLEGEYLLVARKQ
jgi:2-polyprenyl-3-methyl-5-hydroxy-6-metoxy-1,4-benzoquinol methylase